MRESIIRYPLDTTAQSSSNRVNNELYVIEAGSYLTRVVRSGPFFSESLVIQDIAGGEPWVRGTDYVVSNLFEDATVKTGKEVHISFTILRPTFVGELLLSYGVVGGEFSTLYPTVVDIVDAIKSNYENISYGDLTNVPLTFPPKSHLHNMATDARGLDPLIEEIQALGSKLNDAILFNLSPVERLVNDAVLRNDRLQRQPFEGSMFIGSHTGHVTFIMPGTLSRSSTFTVKMQIRNNENFEDFAVTARETVEGATNAIVHNDSDYSAAVYRDKNGALCVTVGTGSTTWLNATLAIDSILWDEIDDVYRDVPVRWSLLPMITLETRAPTYLENFLTVGAVPENKVYGYSSGKPFVGLTRSDGQARGDTVDKIEAVISALPTDVIGDMARPTLFNEPIEQWIAYTDETGPKTLIRISSGNEQIDNTVLRINTKSGLAVSSRPMYLGDGSLAWLFHGNALPEWYYENVGRVVQLRIEAASDLSSRNYNAVEVPEDLTPFIDEINPIRQTSFDTAVGTTLPEIARRIVSTGWQTDIGPSTSTSRTVSVNTQQLTVKNTTLTGDGEFTTNFNTSKATNTTFLTDVNTTTGRQTSQNTNTTRVTVVSVPTNRSTSVVTNTQRLTTQINTDLRDTSVSTTTNFNTNVNTNTSRSTNLTTSANINTTFATTTSFNTNVDQSRSTSTVWSTSRSTSFGTSRNTVTTFNTNAESRFLTSTVAITTFTASTDVNTETGITTTFNTTVSKNTLKGTTQSVIRGTTASRSTQVNTNRYTSYYTNIIQPGADTDGFGQYVDTFFTETVFTSRNTTIDVNTEFTTQTTDTTNFNTTVSTSSTLSTSRATTRSTVTSRNTSKARNTNRNTNTTVNFTRSTTKTTGTNWTTNRNTTFDTTRSTTTDWTTTRGTTKSTNTSRSTATSFVTSRNTTFSTVTVRNTSNATNTFKVTDATESTTFNTTISTNTVFNTEISTNSNRNTSVSTETNWTTQFSTITNANTSKATNTTFITSKSTQAINEVDFERLTNSTVTRSTQVERFSIRNTSVTIDVENQAITNTRFYVTIWIPTQKAYTQFWQTVADKNTAVVTSFIPDTSRRTLIGTQFETIITRQSQKLTQVQTTRETQSDEYTSVPGGFGYVNTRPIVNTEVNTNGYTSYDPLTQYVNTSYHVTVPVAGSTLRQTYEVIGEAVAKNTTVEVETARNTITDWMSTFLRYYLDTYPKGIYSIRTIPTNRRE